MFEDAFYKIGERIGSLQAQVICALALAAATLVILLAAGLYLWSDPLTFCRQRTTSLVFGTAMGSDRKVEAADWARFVDEAILPRFPDGFTLLEAQGAWRASDSGAAVREDSHILMVARPRDGAIDGKLAAIIDEYKARFRQDSVLRMDQCSAYEF
ncbi:DUF3574 domain-containing protein [uncultured Ferrovibrio sp.]|jgi:hypothetical protein|uniref:DUF3574 domain-containing protein n=1 Tax=uncultured Ferrovibrio sp. TaxID=1576913 RepID=UPI002612B1A7|nr:DUF3574 domain-containing protein [uncultured Ferrovibrio sp.]